MLERNGYHSLAPMRLALIVFLLAYGLRADPTPPEDRYLLSLKYSGTMLSVRDLCFADSSAYFIETDKEAAGYLALHQMERIDRDTHPEELQGWVLGLGFYVAASVLNYYAGGGNKPGVFFDRKTDHILGVVVFGLPFSTLTSILYGIKAEKTLYYSRHPAEGEALRRAFACRQSLRRSVQPDSAYAPRSQVKAVEPIPEKTVYQDLKPGIDRQKHLDSLLFANTPLRNRIEVATGFVAPLGSPIARESWRVTGSRLLTVRDGNLYSVVMGFSRTETLVDVGSRNMLDLEMGVDSPLEFNLSSRFRSGLRVIYPANFFDEETDFPLPLLAIEFGLSWKWERWSLFIEGGMPFPLLIFGARAGLGLDF